MDSILSEIVDAHYTLPRDTPEASSLWDELRQTLNRDDRKRLLQLVDGKNLLVESAALSNYREGFCDGLRLACAAFLENRSVDE